LFNSTIYQIKLPHTLKFHALLNQFEVNSSGQLEMFLTLTAALNYMSRLHDEVPIAKTLLRNGGSYDLAVKISFNRESLPVPLRPYAYLDKQWFLSSARYVWSIQK